MRRTAAAILLFFFGALLPSATVVALAAPQQLLPICCRTHGKHACSMVAAESAPAIPTLRPPACPFGDMLHAITTVTIATGLVERAGPSLACIGMAWVGSGPIIAVRFQSRFAARGPPLSFSV